MRLSDDRYLDAIPMTWSSGKEILKKIQELELKVKHQKMLLDLLNEHINILSSRVKYK